MSLSRRDAWILTALLGAALVLLACRAWGPREPRPFAIARLDPPAPLPRIDLNRASAAELEALPGIGPVMARTLIARRPFRSLEDLERVPGLGPRGIARLEPRVSFGAPSSP